MTFNKNNHLSNDIITVLNANFEHVIATQTECLCKLNCPQKQIKACRKQNGIR